MLEQRLGIGGPRLSGVKLSEQQERRREVGLVLAVAFLGKLDIVLGELNGLLLLTTPAKLLDLARQGLELVRAECLLADGFRALRKLFCFGAAPFSLVEIGEVDEAGGYQWVIGAERLLADRERAFEQRLRLGKARLRFVKRSEPSERGRVFRVVLAVALACKGDIALGKWHCCRDLVLAVSRSISWFSRSRSSRPWAREGPVIAPAATSAASKSKTTAGAVRKALPHLQWSSLM